VARRLRGVDEWLAGVGLMIAWPVVVLVLAGVPLLTFWIVPSIVWFSVLGDWPVRDAADHAATLAAGPQDVPPRFGLEPLDWGVMGLFLFNVVFWLVVLAPFAALVWFVGWWWDRLTFDRVNDDLGHPRTSIPGRVARRLGRRSSVSR
jgi:hypothetical protein